MNGFSIKLIFMAGASLGLVLVAANWLFPGSGKAAPSGGRIEGTALNEQRHPVAEVVIVITATTASGSYPEIAPVTNEKGEFSFSSLPPGQYTLRAARADFKEQTQVVTVKEGQIARVEFILRR
jgi:hypothetical protein